MKSGESAMLVVGAASRIRQENWVDPYVIGRNRCDVGVYLVCGSRRVMKGLSWMEEKKRVETFTIVIRASEIMLSTHQRTPQAKPKLGTEITFRRHLWRPVAM